MVKLASQRIHILGASGSGTTTFGRALASRMSIPFFDTDDFYWMPSNPPYVEKRPIPERVRLMRDLFLERPKWVLSGSLTSWSEPLIPYFDIVFFLSLDDRIRIERLRQREINRYGEDAISNRGTQFEAYSAFMDWAQNYENDNFPGRSRKVHEAWIDGLDCKVIRLDTEAAVNRLVDQALEVLNG